VCPFSCRQALGVLSYLQEIAPGVVQCQVPPHKPGIVYFWLACIEEGSDTVDLTALPKEGDTVQYSQPVPFYYAPMDPAGITSPSSPSHCASLHWGSHDGHTGRLSLAWELVGHNDILSVMKHFKYTAKELDLSNNGLAYGPTTAFDCTRGHVFVRGGSRSLHVHRNIDCLEGFRELNTLILDNNHLTHDTKFPPMPKLRTLSINHNWYDTPALTVFALHTHTLHTAHRTRTFFDQVLTVGIRLIEVDKFLDNIVAAAPNLRYLSTLHNAACPFFSSSKHHYYNYRRVDKTFFH
jgi:hypothetical protein